MQSCGDLEAKQISKLMWWNMQVDTFPPMPRTRVLFDGLPSPNIFPRDASCLLSLQDTRERTFGKKVDGYERREWLKNQKDNIQTLCTLEFIHYLYQTVQAKTNAQRKLRKMVENSRERGRRQKKRAKRQKIKPSKHDTIELTKAFLWTIFRHQHPKDESEWYACCWKSDL